MTLGPWVTSKAKDLMSFLETKNRSGCLKISTKFWFEHL